jgi:hypothetical protein
VIPLCSLYVAVSASDECTAGSAWHSSVSECLNLIVRDFDLCVHFKTTVSNAHDWVWRVRMRLRCQWDGFLYCCAVVLLCSDHSELGKLLSFSKGGWLLPCFMEWDAPSTTLCIYYRLPCFWRLYNILMSQLFGPNYAFFLLKWIPMLTVVCLVPVSHELLRWYCTSTPATAYTSQLATSCPNYCWCWEPLSCLNVLLYLCCTWLSALFHLIWINYIRIFGKTKKKLCTICWLSLYRLHAVCPSSWRVKRRLLVAIVVCDLWLHQLTF